MNSTCPFCDEMSLQNRLIKENELAKAFLTNIPIVPGHTLIIPKRHVMKFSELSQDESKSIFELMNDICHALRAAFDTIGFNFAWNEGKAAGQSVPHFHLHIVPRKDNDEGIYEYDPRKYLYRPGSRAKSMEPELIEVSTLIKSNLV